MNKIINLIVSDRVVSSMKKLNMSWQLEEKIYRYYYEKIKLCFLILIVGITVSVLCITVGKKDIISDGRILRNDYDKGTKKITLIAEESTQTGEAISHNINLNVSEKRYSDSDIAKLSENFKEELNQIILNENKSFDYVTSNLSFPKKIDGFPFSVSYSVTKPLMISRDGVVNEEHIIDGSEVGVSATISYYEYQEEYTFFLCLYKPELSDEESFERGLDEALLLSDEKTINEDYYVLPNDVRGRTIRYYEKSDNTWILILLITFTVTISAYFLKDKEIDDEVIKKEEQLMLEYPRLINKFTLFYNAGMPIKKIWFKICSDYEKESKNNYYLYEEMLITRNQIIDGMGEIEAYEEFAKRVYLRRYQVFINLIIQAIVIGKKEFSKSLEIECQDAFNERKNRAKQLFEEAGTKLLVPMFMMLFVVVIIIMFPAFYSFKF